jgi:hypothetical protein
MATGLDSGDDQMEVEHTGHHHGQAHYHFKTIKQPHPLFQAAVLLHASQFICGNGNHDNRQGGKQSADLTNPRHRSVSLQKCS